MHLFWFKVRVHISKNSYHQASAILPLIPAPKRSGARRHRYFCKVWYWSFTGPFTKKPCIRVCHNKWILVPICIHTCIKQTFIRIRWLYLYSAYTSQPINMTWIDMALKKLCLPMSLLVMAICSFVGYEPKQCNSTSDPSLSRNFGQMLSASHRTQSSLGRCLKSHQGPGVMYAYAENTVHFTYSEHVFLNFLKLDVVCRYT